MITISKTCSTEGLTVQYKLFLLRWQQETAIDLFLDSAHLIRLLTLFQFGMYQMDEFFIFAGNLVLLYDVAVAAVSIMNWFLLALRVVWIIIELVFVYVDIIDFTIKISLLSSAYFI